jgi:hypothetical protein
MNKERFKELFSTLLTGNVVEIQTKHPSKWIQARLSRTGENFEIATPQGWRASPLGGAGHEDWRYPSDQKFLG